MYIVKRNGFNGVDYLKGWDSDYGTVCIGDKKQAMAFTTLRDAKQAVVRASFTCSGYGTIRPMKMIFGVVEL